MTTLETEEIKESAGIVIRPCSVDESKQELDAGLEDLHIALDAIEAAKKVPPETLQKVFDI